MNVSNVKKMDPNILLIDGDLTIINFEAEWPLRY
jgi:hypothetical protein